MNLNKSCPYCHNLTEDYKCKKGKTIQNAGACFIEIVDNKAVIVENCKLFEDEKIVLTELKGK